MSAAPTPYASGNPSAPPTSTTTPHPETPVAAPRLPPPAMFDFVPDLHALLTRLIQTPSQPADQPSDKSGQPPADGPLEINQLTTAAVEIKRKIQRARDAVLALPDLDRSLEDQEEEIADLEKRNAYLTNVLRMLGKPITDDEKMGEDIEGIVDDQRMDE